MLMVKINLHIYVLMPCFRLGHSISIFIIIDVILACINMLSISGKYTDVTLVFYCRDYNSTVALLGLLEHSLNSLFLHTPVRHPDWNQLDEMHVGTSTVVSLVLLVRGLSTVVSLVTHPTCGSEDNMLSE